MRSDLALDRADPHQASVEIAMATEADAGAWDQFVTAQPAATGYHEWAWRRVFTGALKHESIYLTARRAGRISGVLPLVQINSLVFGRTMTSLPFVNYGGVLADDEADAVALVEEAARIARTHRCRYVELRHTARRFAGLPNRQHKVAMRLPLQAGLWDTLDRKVRNQVRKAQKSSLTASSGGPELLDEFYAVFARNMRDLGTPVQGRGLFEEVLAAFPGRARIHAVRLGGRTVAAGLTYRTRDSVEVPWASSVRDFNALCPNHLLYWSIIEEAIDAGCRTLDFGRSTPDEGTFRFKQQWGAVPSPFFWEYRLISAAAVPATGPSDPRFSLAIALWKKLPLAVTTRLGPAIVRSIP